jgi:MurNAc alpha-1-phosphate uridylyltransferase
MKAMILAAGLGTRLKPFTDHHPKALVCLENETLLSLNIKKLLRFGIKDIIVNVHHFAEQIVEYLQNNENFGANITISDETASVLETGGGVQKAIREFNIEGALIVCNADILSNIDYDKFINYHIAHKKDVSLAIKDRVSSRKLLFDEKMEMIGWHNQQTGEYKPASLLTNKDYEAYAFSGIQIINADLFQHTSLQGKFSLIDFYLEQLGTAKINGYLHNEDLLLDVGKPDALEQAITLYKSCM